MRANLLLALLLAFAACGTTPPEVDAGPLEVDAGLPEVDAGQADAGQPDAGHKADHCASTFGELFTNAFGRADGTVTAVVPPAWQCPLPNGDHVVIQVSIDGGIQRLVVNIQSSFGDPNIRYRTMTAPLPAPAYAEGWHPGLTLDYPALGLHSDAGWEALTLEQAATRVYDAVTIGAPLSVYASSSGGTFAASAHKIHRNGAQNDGAIIVDPTGAQPTWLLFHFANQTF